MFAIPGICALCFFIFVRPQEYFESLQRVPTLEPLRGTRAHVGDLLDRCETATELVAALTGQG